MLRICFAAIIYYMLLFQSIRCNVSSIMLEMDRILRPGGRVYIRDSLAVMDELVEIGKAIGWHMTLRDTSEGPHASYRVLVGDKRTPRGWFNEITTKLSFLFLIPCNGEINRIGSYFVDNYRTECKCKYQSIPYKRQEVVNDGSICLLILDNRSQRAGQV